MRSSADATTHLELAAERDDPYVLSAEKMADLLADAPWQRFCVLGDSIASGLTEPVPGYLSSPWADRIASVLQTARPDFEYRNLGVPGHTAREIRDGQLREALHAEPDLVGLVGGGNDLLVHEFDPAPVEAVLDEMISALTERGATVVVLTMFNLFAAIDIPGAEELGRRLDLLRGAVIAAASRSNAVLVDLHTEPASAEASIYTSDLQHANVRGHAIAASAVALALGRRLRGGDGKDGGS